MVSENKMQEAPRALLLISAGTAIAACGPGREIDQHAALPPAVHGEPAVPSPGDAGELDRSRHLDGDAGPGGDGGDTGNQALRHEIERAVSMAYPTERLSKAELRPTMKSIIPLLHPCYDHERARNANIGGVINTELTITNEPELGMILRVNGFDTYGKLGESRAFLACVAATLESRVFEPIEARGSVDVLYPVTFASTAPGTRDKHLVERAERAAAGARWTTALSIAERGLNLTSLNGPLRRRLVEIAGLSACHMGDRARARHYFLLASPEFEDRLQQTCLSVASIDVSQ